MTTTPDGDSSPTVEIVSRVPPVPDVSVVIPVFDAAAYLPRAVASLLAQRGPSWELVLVDDGSRDDPDAVVRHLLAEQDLTVVRHPANRGLGAACNSGLDAARGRYIAYLPADDVWFAGHLEHLVAALEADGSALAAHCGVHVDGADHLVQCEAGLQACQVLHRAGAVRWRTRELVESDDLERTVWRMLRAAGPVIATGRVTAEWTQHAGQRRRTFLAAYDGGLNRFRRTYGVARPLLFAPSDADPVDEADLYGQPDEPPPPSRDALHVLLVGELAYNADRVLDLAARDVRLSGLWIDDPLGFMAVGPLPFGAVTDVPRRGWREALRRDRPDVAYCLLNWRTIPLALTLADAMPELPIVWHFKEAPQRCLARGQWPALAALWERADIVLVCSAEEREWLLDALPGRRHPATVDVMDGDLPRGRWFTTPAPSRTGRMRRASDDHPIHTVCLGRPIGLDVDTVAAFARADIHLHLHGLPPAARAAWWPQLVGAAPDHVHLHRSVPPPRWRQELGGYDAGWLHAVPPANRGELRRARWEDLNVPARLPTLAAAGVPALVPDPAGQISAVGRMVDETGAGLLYGDKHEVIDRLRDRSGLSAARAAMARERYRFRFDHEADRLVALLRQVAGRGR